MVLDSAATTHQITINQVKHVANLSDIPVTDQEAAELAAAFAETLNVIKNLQTIDTTSVEPTHQVTGLENVTRPDDVNSDTMFSQEQALANATQTHDGYFVVDRVIDKDVLWQI